MNSQVSGRFSKDRCCSKENILWQPTWFSARCGKRSIQS